MDWTVIHRGHEYTISTTFAAVAFAALVMCVVVVIVLAFERRRWERARWGSVRIATVVLVGLGLLSLLSVTVTMALSGAVDSFFSGAFNRTSSCWMIFGHVLWAELGISFLGTVCALLFYFFVMTRSPGRDRRGRAIALFVGLGLSWMGTQISGVHAMQVAALERLPVFAGLPNSWFHVGQRYERTSVLRRARHESRWTVAELAPILANEPGEVEIVERAHSTYVAVSKRSRLTAKRELGNPGFPLRVGNRWVFTEIRKSSTQVLLVLNDSHEHSEEGGWTLEVTGARVVDGVRYFEVASRGVTSGDRRFSLYAVDGETYLRRERTRRGDGERNVVLSLPEPGSDYPFEFPLKRGGCRGVAARSKLTEVPGPCVCSRSRSGLGTALTAVLTMGTVIPGGRDTWRLERSVRGAEDAAHAPVSDDDAFVPIEQQPCPGPEAASTRHCVKAFISFSLERRAHRLLKRMNEAGVAMAIRDRHFLVFGTPAQLEEHLGVVIEHSKRPSLCPGTYTCVSSIDSETDGPYWNKGYGEVSLVAVEQCAGFDDSAGSSNQ